MISAPAGWRRSSVADFSFRAVQPFFAGRPMALCGIAVEPGRYELWAGAPDGRTAMTAKATLGSAGSPR